jgi:hypothetical protein
MEHVPLLATEGHVSISSPPTRLFARRFLVLFVFSLNSFNQCLLWITYSPISEHTEEYYNISPNIVELMLNWGPIVYIATLPLVMVLADVENGGGLRKVQITAAFLTALCGLIRLLPGLVSSTQFESFSRYICGG